VTYRGLATLLFRCSGLISIVTGLLHTVGYLPMAWTIGWEGRHASGSMGALSAVVLPGLSAVLGGLAVFLLAPTLARIATRGLE
jgi:hypothetical protein